MIRLFSKITGILWTQVVSKFQSSKGIVRVGEYTYGDPQVLSFCDKDIVFIGKFCSIADDVVIVAGGEHRYNRVSTFPLKSRFLKNQEMDSYNKGPVIIGNDVWIGTRATILSGVRIGHGAVVGAAAVVAHDVPPYAIVVGIPARIVGYRFSKSQIAKLLEISWWNWSIKKILANIDYFYGDVNDFITAFSCSNEVNAS